ncbi:MAG: ATP-binding protein [Planctomycetota bacterium]|jgi:signal transduction histidine kinase/tetratricopeptide (TPR) repeat protein
METSIHRRRRILLHFFLGIGLPSLLLGYLAFRGIQNDVALLEEERLNEHNAIAQQITESLNDKISAAEGAFLDSVANHQAPQQDSGVLRLLERLKSQEPLVEEVFLFESAEHVQLPLAKLLFLSAGSAESLTPQSQPSALLLGRQYEFQQQRYQEALASYQQAFAQVPNHQVKGEALNAIARVQKKSHLYPDAIKSYRTIAQDYNDIRLSSGMPLGLVAQLELGALFVAVDDSSNAGQTLIRLYQDLIHAEWALEESQYEFLAREVEEAIDGIVSQNEPIQSYQSTFKTLRGEEKKQKQITERLLAFQENAAPNLRAKVPRKMEDSRNQVRRFTLEIGEHSYLVSILSWQKGDGNQPNGIWGLLLNSELLKTNLLQPVIRQHASSKDIQWIIRGRDGEVILQSDELASIPMTVKSSFVGNFPPWSLELYQQNPRLFETLLASRRGIYLYMFVLLAGILIFGLTLTIRIVSHELELGKMKSDFVSTVSHEFKSPLTSIRQLAEMLQTGRVASDERRQRYYDVLLEQSERLSLLIDNILDFARMEEGKKEFEFEMVDIGPLLEEIVSTIQQQVRHEKFTVEAEIDAPLPSIQVDRAAITQAITNLIDNAIKYSAGAKKVLVRGFTENQYLIIAVHDFGVGIKPEEIDRVFERFYRGGDELTRTVKGSGLGLTLVKQIVEAHHGSVHVESEPGRGSTFSILLPLELTEAK